MVADYLCKISRRFMSFTDSFFNKKKLFKRFFYIFLQDSNGSNKKRVFTFQLPARESGLLQHKRVRTWTRIFEGLQEVTTLLFTNYG